MIRFQNVLLLTIVATIAIILSILTFQYSIAISAQVVAISDEDVRLNSEITVHDLSRVLVNQVGNIFDNLQIISSSQAVKEGNIDRAKALFQSGQDASNKFTDSYFWVDKDGKLLWANAFSNQTTYEKYKGGDRSTRSYYLEPKQTLQPHVSAVIESIDGVPRLYMSWPIMVEDPANPGAKSFDGVVVAASGLEQIGQFLTEEVSPKMQSSIGMTDRNGIILYSQTTSIIGKNVFGPETQSILPAEMRETFNSIVRKALSGKTGSGDFTYNGTVTTISYQPLAIYGHDFGVLYVVTPHTLAGSTSGLIEQQRNFSTITLLIIGAVAVAISVVILTWNKRLQQVVVKRSNELKHSNESLQAAVEQLKLHDKMQREFINIAAHELRTPIQPLLGIVETMRISMEEEHRTTIELSEEEIAMLERNARRLEGLTKKILDVTRIESNMLSLEKEKFDMNTKIENVIKDLKGNAVMKGDRMIVAFPRTGSGKGTTLEFTRYPAPLYVEADKTRIFEVLSNLIENAMKFTKEGEIEIRLSNVDGKALVEITDSGKGIDPEIMPNLFSKFTTRSEKGTGLGLYISKNIIQAHGGKMGARNNGNSKGATFWFDLPLVETKETALSEYASPEQDRKGAK